MRRNCKCCGKEFETNDLRKRYCSKECSPKLNEEIKKHFIKERWIVLVHYGGDPPKCACCGESHFEFLALDHIKGGGLRHLQSLGFNKRNGGRGRGIYHWLIKNGFPEGYRVLCHNCNNALGFYGYCPHSGKTQEQPNDVGFHISNSNRIVRPSRIPKETHIQFRKRKLMLDCKNCGMEYDSDGALHYMTLGFCSEKCHQEWREKEKKKLNL